MCLCSWRAAGIWQSDLSEHIWIWRYNGLVSLIITPIELVWWFKSIWNIYIIFKFACEAIRPIRKLGGFSYEWIVFFFSSDLDFNAHNARYYVGYINETRENFVLIKIKFFTDFALYLHTHTHTHACNCITRNIFVIVKIEIYFWLYAREVEDK